MLNKIARSQPLRAHEATKTTPINRNRPQVIPVWPATISQKFLRWHRIFRNFDAASKKDSIPSKLVGGIVTKIRDRLPRTPRVKLPTSQPSWSSDAVRSGVHRDRGCSRSSDRGLPPPGFPA